MTVKRYGQVIRISPDKIAQYKRLHANIWPEVNRMIQKCNIRNYSIYYRDGFLFGYFEYEGDHYEEDMARMAADPVTQEWWKVCKPLQNPLHTRSKGEWWAEMEEIYHLD